MASWSEDASSLQDLRVERRQHRDRAARLWKREVVALIMPPGWETPWDSNPVVGISKKLGYAFLRPDPDRKGKSWKEYETTPVLAKRRREHDTLIVHRHDCAELMKALAELRA